MPNSRMSPQLGAVPNPDPTERTVEQLQRDLKASRELLESKIDAGLAGIVARLDGMDKGIVLLQQFADKQPTSSEVHLAVNALRDHHDEKFRSQEEQLRIQFSGIAIQFAERDKRTEQLSLADKTAIAAALQAQKEAAGAQNESNTTANTKMEGNFAKLIEQGQSLLMEVRRNTEAQINDLKSRLDKGEGRSVATTEVQKDSRDNMSLMVAMAAVAIALAGFFLKH